MSKAPKPPVSDEQLMVDLLADLVAGFSSSQLTRKILAEALLGESPVACRKLVAEARHQMAQSLQMLYSAVEVANEICKRMGWPPAVPPALNGNGKGGGHG